VTSGLLGRLRLMIARPHCAKVPARGGRRSARVAVAWFVAASLGLSGATLLAADVLCPAIRDPEYGRRASALHARLAENPGRPLVLVVGSSRVGAGVCPAAWESVRPANPARPDPLLFNLGRAGAGPVVQLMMLRRVLAEGVRPAVVLLEYWPPLLNHEHAPEFLRIPPEHVFPADLPLVRDYWRDGGEFERRAWRSRLNPVFSLKRTLMLQVAPEWLPWPKRTEMVWANLDPWGWLPGLDLPAEGSAERERWLTKWEPIFRPQLRTFAVSEPADRALREAVSLARQHGAAVGFVYLPESSEFRGWYSRKAQRAMREHFAKLTAALGVPAIDARDWVRDGHVGDGFHLTRLGAEEFTRKLAPALVAALPGGKP
jgi:hypothetical protein